MHIVESAAGLPGNVHVTLFWALSFRLQYLCLVPVFLVSLLHIAVVSQTILARPVTSLTRDQ